MTRAGNPSRPTPAGRANGRFPGRGSGRPHGPASRSGSDHGPGYGPDHETGHGPDRDTGGDTSPRTGIVTALLPRTCGFDATFERGPNGEVRLVVQGRVETEAGNLLPVLSRHAAQASDPSILVLSLELHRTDSPAAAVRRFRRVRHVLARRASRTRRVAIMWGGEVVELFEATGL